VLSFDARQPLRQVWPLCRDHQGDASQACTGCDTEYHADCLAELGGCSTLGCQLHGKLPQHLDRWRGRACHDPRESDLARRRCPCGAFVHNDRVPAHADACPQAQILLMPSRTPAARAEPTPTPWFRLVSAPLPFRWFSPRPRQRLAI